MKQGKWINLHPDATVSDATSVDIQCQCTSVYELEITQITDLLAHPSNHHSAGPS